MSSSGIDVRRLVTQHLGLLLPAVIVGAIIVLIAPLSPIVLDLLISANISVAVVMLLTTVQVRRPTDFHVFPSLLLATTLTRLVLNVASTRLILSEAATQGESAAGGVIGAFGSFVAGGSPAVGLVIFVVLVAIQFLVITKGATRISEVAARFALEGMTGRLASIDADLHSGRIDGNEAMRRRESVNQQADFYGAMDGAGKFVRGDAIAGLLITVINLVGGLAIGVIGEEMPVDQAIRVFSTLTIGDGLVSQLPAILISLAAGFLVTQSSSDSRLADDVVGQMFGQSTPLLIASLLLVGLAFTGLPMLPLLLLAGICAGIGLLAPSTRSRSAQLAAEGFVHSEQHSDTGRNHSPNSGVGSAQLAATKLPTGTRTPASQHPAESQTSASRHGGRSSNSTSSPATNSPVQSSSATRSSGGAVRMEQSLSIEPLALELGVSLVRLADRQAGGDLLDRVAEMRDRIASNLGFIVPKLTVRDNLQLDPRHFRVLLRGIPVATGTIYADCLLAVQEGPVSEPMSGVETSEPRTGHPALWVKPAEAVVARQRGYRVVEAVNVLTQSLDHVVRLHGNSLLTRTQVHDLLDHLHLQAPQLVDDLFPDRLTTTELHRVLANLLTEQVSIRDLEAIVESLGDTLFMGDRQIQTLTEAARVRLGRSIVAPLCDSDGILHTVEFDEDNFRAIDPHDVRSQSHESLIRLEECLDTLVENNHPAVVLCEPAIRPELYQLLSARRRSITVLSHREIPRNVMMKVHPLHSTPTALT